MSLFHILLLLLVLVPLAEIYVLIQVGGVLGALPTIGLVVLTALAGATLMRAQGLSTVAKARASLDRGELPAIALLEGVLILFAGALLLTPGFLTDAVGFVCLIPPCRQYLVKQALARFAERSVPPRGPPSGGGRVIEGEVTRRENGSNSQ